MDVTPQTIQRYDEQMPYKTEIATAALGCFWGPDAIFGGVDGIVKTRVGYAGGDMDNPQYHDLGTHTETIQLEYDPAQWDFSDVIKRIARSMTLDQQPQMRQYHNILFYTDSREHDIIQSTIDSLSHENDDVIVRIEPIDTFYTAESYHQKYHLRTKRWAVDAFNQAGYDAEALRESPAAAVINSSLAGHTESKLIG
jgi:Peptide methionine sulfoxide reductase